MYYYDEISQLTDFDCCFLEHIEKLLDDYEWFWRKGDIYDAANNARCEISEMYICGYLWDFDNFDEKIIHPKLNRTLLITAYDNAIAEFREIKRKAYERTEKQITNEINVKEYWDEINKYR